ncbi:hypothetical protein EVAR_74735_1 [Eumeta japonica]|uniref:SERTA domain-containing protein n=1 Tax=Eumeta variegata TaxID=151549 RepID=A0A4C1SRS9_EUMVA|nr:hypothetical protein EVAR_74735_1 [Eumeta japonica]
MERQRRRTTAFQRAARTPGVRTERQRRAATSFTKFIFMSARAAERSAVSHFPHTVEAGLNFLFVHLGTHPRSYNFLGLCPRGRRLRYFHRAIKGFLFDIAFSSDFSRVDDVFSLVFHVDQSRCRPRPWSRFSFDSDIGLDLDPNPNFDEVVPKPQVIIPNAAVPITLPVGTWSPEHKRVGDPLCPQKKSGEQRAGATRRAHRYAAPLRAAAAVGSGGGCGAKRRAGSPCEGGGGKIARWEDSIARLEAVAAGAGGGGAECWRPDDEERRACRRRWCGGWCGAHDTIRAENGKSYLELGGATTRACCDGRAAGRCASRRCYRERRLKMMNLCALKLARFRQTADPSLRRSVLVCNTLRGIEREMERESVEEAPEGIACGMGASAGAGGATARCELLSARDSAAGRATPFPTPPPPDRDSGFGDEERTIDWGSVLSLSSRSALDPAEDTWAEDWGWPDDGLVRLLVPTMGRRAAPAATRRAPRPARRAPHAVAARAGVRTDSLLLVIKMGVIIS